MIWLLNRPAAVRRALAVTLLATVMIAVLATAYFAASGLERARASIVEQRVLLGRLQVAVKQFSLEEARLQVPAQDISFSFLSGDSEPVIRAELQQRFKTAAMRYRVGVVSVGDVPNFEKEGISYTGLQANISGTIESLQKLLLELETSTPILFIPQITIRSTENHNTRQRQIREPQLIAQLRLYGALRPEITVSESNP